MKQEELQKKLIEAVATGWTTEKNKAKEMDTELVEAIVQEISPLMTTAYEKEELKVRRYLEEFKNKIHTKLSKLLVEKKLTQKELSEVIFGENF